MLDVSLWGVIHGVHAFRPLLLKNSEGGHIMVSPHLWAGSRPL